mgnify:CR=1 FL=1
MQTGGEPQMQPQGQDQMPASANDPMEQLVPAIKSAIEQGMPLAQLIMTLAQNEVPMEAIQQGLVTAGLSEQEIMGAMNELQEQQTAPAPEGPIQPTQGEPAEGQIKRPPVDMVREGQPSQTPIAQDGAEVDGLDYSAPIEDIITDRGDGYHYKKITDPGTGEMTYFTKSAKGTKWRDLQESGNEVPLKSTRADVFGDNVDEWEGTEEQKVWDNNQKANYLKDKRDKERAARSSQDVVASETIPSYQDITKEGSGYTTRVVAYPKGTNFSYLNMPPGHIETILIDPNGNPVLQYRDNDDKVQDALVNRWEEKGQSYAMVNDSGGDDNAGKGTKYAKHYRSKGQMDAFLKGSGARTLDIQLNSGELASFLNTAASESAKDYHFVDNNCADGVCRAYGVDDKRVGQTTGVVGIADIASTFGVGEGGRGALTDPDMVFNTLAENYKGRSTVGGAEYTGRTDGAKGMAKALIPAVKNLGIVDRVVPDWMIDKESQKVADKELGILAYEGAKKVIDGVALVYKGGRWVKNQIEDIKKEILPKSIIDGEARYEKADGLLNGINAFFGGDPNYNTGSWYNFQEGGEPGRYENVLDQAQYGMGLNYNQIDDSVRGNINSAYMPMNLGMKGKNVNLLATIGEGASRLFGAKDKDGDGLGDGAFRDMKAKRNRHKDTMDFMKGKTPKGMENMGDKLMMKYDSETGNYNTAYNDPRYQSNITEKKYANLFKKGEKVNTGELLNKPLDYQKEGYKSFNQLKSDMSGLDQDAKDQLQYVADERTAFENNKDKPKGTQFGMDSKGGVGYYDKDAELPEDSQKNINNMMMQNYKNGGSYNNPGFNALPPAVQQKIMSGIQKGQNGKEIMTEIQAADPNGQTNPEALVRQYEDIIRKMQQQHAMEMEQLMMQMQRQVKGPSPETMQEGVGAMPPMQMGGGFGLPFAQEGGEGEPAIFDTEKAKSQITNASPSQRQFLNDGLDMIKQSMLSQQGATAGATGPRPGEGSGSDVDNGIGGGFPYRRSPEERQMDKDARQNERQERRDLRGGNNMGGRERRPDHDFTKVGKFAHNISPWNWTKDKQVRSNPTRFAGKGKKIRQEGGEEIGETVVPELTPEQLAMQERLNAANTAYDTEMSRVTDIRGAVSARARELGDANASASEAGISDNLAKWVDSTGFACNTYSCQIMRDAGVTIPEGQEEFKVNGRTYGPGDKIPMIPGNAQFNSYAQQMGFELQPKGTMPTEEGDLIRGHMYDQPGGASSGSQHSVISAGYGDDEVLDLYNNPGGVYEGYKSRNFEGDEMRTGEGNYYTDDSGVMRYVGATPRLEQERNAIQAEYDAMFKQMGGMIDQSEQPRQMQPNMQPSDPRMMEMQYMNDAAQQMMDPQGQAQMMQQAMNPEQLMQMQQYLQQLLQEIQEASPKARSYKKASPHDMDSVELSTEQIAKIMAAGGSVKIL